MLDHRLRRWIIINTALDQCLMFVGLYVKNVYQGDMDIIGGVENCWF